MLLFGDPGGTDDAIASNVPQQQLGLPCRCAASGQFFPGEAFLAICLSLAHDRGVAQLGAHPPLIHQLPQALRGYPHPSPPRGRAFARLNLPAGVKLPAREEFQFGQISATDPRREAPQGILGPPEVSQKR